MTGSRIGCGPLHHASFHGHKEVVTYLLDHKSDINAKDKEGGTAIQNSAFKGIG